MVCCCVPYCKSSSLKKDPGTSFHEFPADKILCRRWLIQIARKDFTINDKSASSVVCSKHFLSSDYVQGIKLKRLKKDAVPSVFPFYPSYLVQPASGYRRSSIKVFSKRPPVKDEAQNTAKKFRSSSDAVSNSESMDTNLKEQQKSDHPLETNTSLLHTKLIDKSNKVPPAQVNKLLLIKVSSKKLPVEDRAKNSPINFGSASDATFNLESTYFNLEEQQKIDHSLETNTGSLHTKLTDKQREIKNLRSLLWKKNQKITKMKEQMEMLEEKVSFYESSKCHQILHKIVMEKDENCLQSHFLLEQLKNFFKKRPTWSETTIRECISWAAISPNGYNFVHNRKLLTLPCSTTLQRHARFFLEKQESLHSLNKDSSSEQDSQDA